jgi:hypothetical protein
VKSVPDHTRDDVTSAIFIGVAVAIFMILFAFALLA